MAWQSPLSNQAIESMVLTHRAQGAESGGPRYGATLGAVPENNVASGPSSGPDSRPSSGPDSRPSSGASSSRSSSSSQMGRVLFHRDDVYYTSRIMGRAGANSLKKYVSGAAVTATRHLCTKFSTMRNTIKRSLALNMIKDKHLIHLLSEYFSQNADTCDDSKPIAEFVEELHEKYFGSMSFLYNARVHPERFPNSVDLYTNLGRWMKNPPRVMPTAQDWRVLFNLTDLYIIKAINECYNSHIGATGRLSVKGDCNPPNRVYAHEERYLGVIRRLLTYRKAHTGFFWSHTTTNGLSVVRAIDTAIDTVNYFKDRIFKRDRFFDFESHIPIGANLAYDFLGGALHHAIYIGNKYLVEVMSYNDTSTGKLKSYVTLTHIYDFVRRALETKPAEILICLYDNPFPKDVIVRRALLALGEYPGYDYMSENCETFCLWVHTNSWTTAGVCLLPESRLPGTDNSFLAHKFSGSSSGGPVGGPPPRNLGPVGGPIAGNLGPVGGPTPRNLGPVGGPLTGNLGGRVGGKRRTRRLRR